VAATFVVSGIPVAGAASSVPTSVAPVAVSSHRASPGIPPSAPDSGLPGQSSTGEPWVDPATLSSSHAPFPRYIVNGPRNATAAHAAALDSVNGSAASPAPPKALGRLAPGYGWVDGTVVTALLPHSAIGGAQVQVIPVDGFCPPQGCAPITTASNGSFEIPAAPGENTILVSDPYFVTNRTWVNVTDGGTSEIGTMELVADGYVRGLLLGDDPSQEPLWGINVTATTRDGTFEAFPFATSTANGSFTVAVPPEPSELNFDPPPGSPYSPNVTFVNVSSGGTIEIGTIYLEHFSPVSVEVVDSITGRPIPAGPFFLQVCSKISSVCANANFSGLPGVGDGGPILEAEAPVGPDSITVGMTGYVENGTSLGFVPPSALNGPPTAMGTIDLVPDGEIAVEVNITGLPPPYGVTSPTSQWPVGLVVFSACSLDGITSLVGTSMSVASSQCVNVCVPPGQPFEIAAPPLRVSLTAAPDTFGGCGIAPTWPIPPDMPVYPNWGWANVTPDRLTNVGSLDLWPEMYVLGEILPKDSTGWIVSICSTDEPTLCGVAVGSDASYAGAGVGAPPSGCPSESAPNANYTFCAPAPPGPDELVVSSTHAAGNFSWANVPFLPWTTMPLPLATATTPSVAAIGLVSATVSGTVEVTGSATPVPYAGVDVCPAGLSPPLNLCSQAVANASGYFQTPASIGWDQVKFSGEGYVPNSTWIDVDQSNSTGTVYVSPVADVEGRVVSTNGAGLYSAIVQSCPAAYPTACNAVGEGGSTSTDGEYFGPLTAGPPPRGTFEIEAAAPGYVTDWTWVNISTPGTVVTAPEIVLAPLQSTGGSLPGAPRARTAGVGSVGAWVTGRVTDLQDQIGLQYAFLTAVPIEGGPAISFTAAQGTGGEFNDSLAVGAYELWVNESGFVPDEVFVNVTGFTGGVDLGAIALQPYPTITGRVVIDPGAWRAGVTYAYGLGAPALVTVCSTEATVCTGGFTDSAGDFNLSAPPGTYDTVNVTPLGTGTGTYPGGFLNNATFVTVTNASGSVGPPTVVGLDIFGAVTGSVDVSNQSGAGPVRYDQIEFNSTAALNTVGPLQDVYGGTQLNQTGNFVFFFPPSRVLYAIAGGAGAWIPEAANYSGHQVGPGGGSGYALGVAGTLALGLAFSLLHFGWVTLQVTNTATGQPVPYATLSAREPGNLAGQGSGFGSTGTANALGYLNMTAPPSLPTTQPLTLNLTAPDYLYQLFSVFVNTSATTVVNTSLLHGGVELEPWGWVGGTVIDAQTGAPIPGVSVVATGPHYQSGRLGIFSSYAGKYLTDAPVAENDSLFYSEAGYTTNTSVFPIYPGEFLDAPAVALTGDATVEGRLLASPGGSPVAGATVLACPAGQLTCATQVHTNATGIFVIDAPAGLDSFTITAPGFVVPSPVYEQVASEVWYWIGTIELNEFGNVAGEALAIPGGLPIVGATVTLCPLAVGGYGSPCFATVQSGANGSFYLSAPAGPYVLEASAPSYNTSLLDLALSAGRTELVGAVFLFEYGVGTGLVEASPAGTPVGGGTITACEAWGARTCRAPVSTGSNGRYVESGPAGPYYLGATAPGYQTSYVAVVLVSGATVTIPTVLLIPIGPGSRYVVAGLVTAAGTNGTPLAGAVVTATGGISTDTSATGAYSLVLEWGTYVLTAGLPGYVTERVSLSLTGPLEDVNFSLAIMTYPVTGVIRDGLSGDPLDGVEFAQGGVPVGPPSAANGSFELALANGTHTLVATDPAEPFVYSAIPFEITVEGAPGVRDLSMVPPVVSVDGVVANALTGQPISGAAFTLTGTTSDGPAYSVSGTTDVAGRFVAPAYPGAYRLVVSAVGFAAGNVSIQLGEVSNSPVSVALAPATASAASASSVSPWLVGGWVVAAGLATAWGVLLRKRRAPS
jgi:hypothetical protein